MPNDLTTPFTQAEDRRLRLAPGAGVEEPVAEAPPQFSDEEILELWTTIRKEAIEPRHPFEVQWRRNLYYILNRQWIEYIPGRGWRDKRIAPWIPRPVTNKCKETVAALRAIFTSIKLGVNVRPNGADPRNVSAATTADELSPIIHEAHDMNARLMEFDFWLLATGNAFFHTFVDYDAKYGTIPVPMVECDDCLEQFGQNEVADTGACPHCGSKNLAPATDEMGQPKTKFIAKGKPMTMVLSPLEIAFPNSVNRFDEVPYVVRMRWRTKGYFMANAALKQMVDDGKITWSSAPSDQNLGLFHSLATHNDLGVTTGGYVMDSGSRDEEGITEYEVWLKPTATYPEGLVFRIYGDQNPVVAHLEQSEALPGPLPYKDADGNPLFTFSHAAYEHVGGRVLGSGPLDLIIQKQDQLNQLDSMILLIIQRMSNPVWMIPKGSEISKFSGMPGLILRWNALTSGGNAKPERIAGEGPHPTLFQIREQYLKDIEDLTGTFDIVKGSKPAGVEAFSAMQLLVEQSQSRFSPVFQARGDAYSSWFKHAIELEREFGPDDRTKATLSPARTWTFQNFKRANLQGSFSIVVENGSTQPKTNLGMRAATEHAAGLGMLNMQDPDVQYEGLKLFGLTKMVPTLDINIQSALQKQQAFEEWVINPQNAGAFVQQATMKVQQYQQALAGATDPNMPMPPAPELLVGTPLELLPWYQKNIHKGELLKWANSDRMREIFSTVPVAKEMVKMHLQEIDAALAQEAAQQAMLTMGPQRRMGGAAEGMTNSNRESTSGNEPKDNGQGAQNQGPA